jgi:heme oxygenase
MDENDPGTADAASSQSARARLRAATDTAHRRLHVHPSFAALASGQIDLPAYRALLARLLGFHEPLEQRLLAAPWQALFGLDMQDRSRVKSLIDDLADLQMTREHIQTLPGIPDAALPALDTPGRFLGCLYVREGATLGGLVLSRKLDLLFKTELPMHKDLSGRRFLTGLDGDAARWSQLCEIIENKTWIGLLPAMISGAADTFAALECWLNGQTIPVDLNLSIQ